MDTRKALLVVAHHRTDSLTARVAAQAGRLLTAEGYTVDVLDLHAEGFDPRMTSDDEPDWGDRDKRYSDEVQAQMARITEAETIVVVFPVWWFSLPAILKGWIDRVWNYGFAYGRSRAALGDKRMLWLGLAGDAQENFVKDGMDELVDRQLRVGVSRFCGIEDAMVRIVYGTIPERHDALALDEHLRGVLTCSTAAMQDFLDARHTDAATA